MIKRSTWKINYGGYLLIECMGHVQFLWGFRDSLGKLHKFDIQVWSDIGFCLGVVGNYYAIVVAHAYIGRPDYISDSFNLLFLVPQ